MTNKEKYEKVFMDAFSVEKEVLEKGLEYNTIPEWDSIGHMSMIAEIEDAFSITMETDDVVNFGSFKQGFEILAKYDIEI